MKLAKLLLVAAQVTVLRDQVNGSADDLRNTLSQPSASK
jgi:hypothetical protein